MRKRFKILSTLATILTILYSSALAGEDTKVNPDPLSCAEDNNLVFRIDVVSTADKYPDTVTNRFFLVNRNANDSLVHLEAKIKWTPAEVTLVSWAKDLGWPPSLIDSQSVITDSTLYFIINFNKYIFDSTKAVVKLTFHTGCYPLNDTADVTFKTDQCVENSVGRPNQPFTNYTPNSTNFKKGGPKLAMTPNANMSNFDAQLYECGDTVIVPIMYNSNITASAGFVAKWKWFDDSLKFIRIDQQGTLTQGKTLDTTRYANDSLRVTTTDNIPRRIGTDTTLMKLVYVYKSALDNVQDSVLHTIDTVRTTCTYVKDANSCLGGLFCKFQPFIPRYSADIYFKETSLYKNTSGQLKQELTNNFTVDSLVAHTDSLTSFRVDTTTFDTIRWDGTISNLFTSGNLNFRWVKVDVQDFNPKGFMVKRDVNNPSNKIPKTDVKREICQVGITARNFVAEDFVQFTREANSSQDLYKRDSKLKSYNRPIVRYSFTAAGIDSLFRLQGGTVTVTNPPPGGGSCPFLYVWDGTKFLEDNDILTTSEFTATGIPVTDYYRISQPLVEQNGQYLLQLREVEDEESFIDELALVTIDHPRSVKVGVTPEGKIIAYDKALFPVACVDQDGKDQLDKILSKDELFFQSDGPGHLLLTFNNPTRKDLFNNMRAEGAPGDGGDAPLKRIGVNTRVTVEIEDSDGQWHNLGVVAPRANVQGAFWILGTSDIQLGEQFRVKLSWDKLYSVDRLAYYVPTDKPWYQKSLDLKQAVHSKKADVTPLVSAYDGTTAKLIPGEAINLSFPVGTAKPDDMVRDFIFKAIGYYTRYEKVSAEGAFTYKLHNNYPNPFNAQTEIQYALPEPSEVNLSVYNIMGQKVRTLIEGRQSAGVHTVTWDGKNEKGETVASGVYFYTIRAGTYIETKKMTLLK